MKITREQLSADSPELLEALLAEGRTQGKAEADNDQAKALAEATTAAITAETARIQGVLDAALPGHEALVQALAFDGKTTPEQAALAVNKAEKAKGSEHLARLASERSKPVAFGGDPTTDSTASQDKPEDGKSFSARITAHITAEAAKGRQLTAAQAAAELRQQGKE